ncbi:hypothetical protein [Dysgonomonas sp. 511]|uniref:hypothetical protein n=1 Tax=Dysgonomonas sp. 511 TaxID=2302930 RepID=UPI0013D52A6B|nr:hypothetical protein [Dysgonomonas sp. 511]NDV77832.1 hypothetical protein [Dysgonomonas sp. 511]
MSERVQTPFNGITTMPAYQEGDMLSLVNLRPEGGVLNPVSPRKITHELSQQYDIVFIHQNNDYKNWIGVINQNGYASVYWDILSDNPKTITSYIQDTIHSIQQVGNTLSLISDSNIYYLFYQNQEYTFLGELPEIPVIRLGTNATAKAQLYYANEYGKNTISKNNFVDATKGLLNKGRDQLVDQYGQQFFDGFILRYAFRLYDGTLAKHSPPILALPPKDITEIKQLQFRFYFYDGEWLTDDSFVTTEGFTLNLGYDLTGELNNWTEIIKSVDIFISPPLGISNTEDIDSNILNDVTSFWNVINIPKTYTSGILSKVRDASTFYLIRSLDIGTTSGFLGDILPDKEKDVSLLDNLIYQELMANDNFSNHKYGASATYVYNNRLHLGNIKTTFFRGFHPGYFNWWTAYNGVDKTTGTTRRIVTEVEVQAGTSVGKVYSAYSDYFSVSKLFSSAMISYPDPRARRITIYEVDDNNVWTRVFTAPLQTHNFLNVAYYLNGDLKPIVGETTPLPVTPPDTSKEVTLSEPNKIKVSELNNPVGFPNANTYQVGNGTILAMATNAMNVSDRNYGQYPLYVFTTQGIWNMNIGDGEVLYSTLSAPTSSETPTTAIVGETPYGVAFTTQRGLSIINGQAVQFISPQIEQRPLPLSIETNAHCDGVVFLPVYEKFSDILKGISALIYNPYHNELIINTPGKDSNFVLRLDYNQFYQSTEKVDLVVGNAFPELLVIGDNKVKDFSLSQPPSTHVSFIMRPLQLGIVGIKRLERMIMRGTLFNVKNPAEDKFSMAITYHSNDGVNLMALRGLSLPQGNIRDKDMGLFGSGKFSRFSFLFAGMLDDNSQIQFLESVINAEYNNTKMR